VDLEAIEKLKREILEAGRRFYCEDNPVIKEKAPEINRRVSPEVRLLHEDSVVIDACSFFLEDYNWHLEESGATALNCTVPGVMDGRGDAVKKIVDYHQTIRGSEKLALVRGMTEESFYSEGIVNLANLPNITDGLLSLGFSREEIQKILGLNYLRVFEQWWD
jgi:hypothetical protein